MPSTLDASIVDSLVDVLDDVRGLVADVVGDHAYRLFKVRRTWSGAERGLGTPTEVETEITPVPLVAASSSYQMQPGGKQEEGTFKVSEVSLRYTEAELCLDGSAANVEQFYRLKDAHGQAMADTEFTLSGSPTPDRTKSIGWTFNLRRAQR